MQAVARTLRGAVKMPLEHEAAFIEGLAGLLARWTALQLAITNEWRGPAHTARHVIDLRHAFAEPSFIEAHSIL